jgi:signal transduction histidine kinase
VGTTVLAVFLAQLGLTLIASSQVIDSKEAVTETEQFMGPYALQVRPFFAGERPDEEGLRKWLETQYITEFQNPDLFPLNNGAYVAQIIDISGRIIASAPDKSLVGSTAKFPETLQRLKEDSSVNGVTKASWADKKMMVVIPILKKEDIVAYGMVESDYFTFWGIFSRGFTRLIASTMTLTGIPTLLIGGGLGVLLSRWVGRRINSISTAAEAWGRGELTVTAPETPNDEFGMLAGRLNTMARDLQQVINLRREVAVLEERENMLRELHDTVKQQAFAASLVVSSARISASQNDKVGLENALGEAEIITRQIQTELAGILAQGRTQTSGSLHEQVARIVDNWRRRSEKQIILDIPAHGPHLNTECIRNIVRIVEEAITNAVKHSHCAQITVTLKNTEKARWEVIIADNGIGFDPQLTRSGMGLETMTERTQALLSGTLSFESVTPQGTKIVVGFGEDQG